MRGSIKRLREGSVPAAEEEIEAAALQFVREISGFRQPAKYNAAVFAQAVGEIATSSQALLDRLVIRGAGG